MNLKIKVNNMISPFTDSAPSFSWEYPDGEFNGQIYYRIIISDKEDRSSSVCDITEYSGESVNIKVKAELLPRTKYYVRVTALTSDGKEYSGETYFCTGLLKDGFGAHWITGHNCKRKDSVLGAVYLRRGFNVRKDIKRAVLYICGLGYFEARINGKKVGDDFLSTPYTAYDKHILYRAFDVSDMLARGENAIGVILGNGFYNCFTDDPWQSATAPWRDVPKLCCRLDTEYTDSTTESVTSGGEWTSLDGPIVFNGIRHGEEYDARFENDGWDMPGYTGETFPCLSARDPGALLSVMEAEPVRVINTYKPVRKYNTAKGTIYDIGQSIAGIAEITYRGARGTKYTVRFSDKLCDNGELDLDSLSGFIHNYIFQTETYIKRTDGEEKHHAIFTYHGFRYIEISGGEELACDDICAWALCNGFAENTVFKTDSDTVNKVFSLCRMTTLSSCTNTLASDTIREKSSWTGDTGLSAEQLLINFGAGQLMKKWMTDLRDSQRPGGCVPCIVPSSGWGYNSMNGPDWSQPVYEVPYNIYMQTGQTDVLADNYDALCRYCGYLTSMSHGGILNYGLGDWCAPFEGEALSVNMESFKCPITVTDTAYYYSAVRSACLCAEILGKKEDEEEFKSLASYIKSAFREKFFDKDTYTVYGDCQSSTSVMLYHGLYNEGEKEGLINKLISQIERENGHLDTGVLGTKAMFDVLGESGNADIGLKMLCNPTYPSVKHWIDSGATTLWECWNGKGSHNHHMFSSVSAFLIKYVGGISALTAGYKTIRFSPDVDGFLGSAYTAVNTPYGKAECSFEKKDGKTEIKITVPRSCKGIFINKNIKKELSAGKHDIII